MPSILTWGYGEFGIHGQGHTETQINPSPLEAFSNKNVKSISAGGIHNIVVTDKNEVFSFGHGGSGQLGTGCNDFQKNPVQIKLSNGDEDGEIVGASCGGRHSLLWDSQGNVYGFGNNFDAQLSYDFEKSKYKENIQTPEIMRVFKMHGIKISHAACGGKHSLFVTNDGKAYSCGLGSSGQLGNDGNATATEVPQPITALDEMNIVRVAAGELQSLALSKNGTVYQWGAHSALGTPRDIQIPEKVEIGRNEHVIDIKCGSSHCIALSASGEVYTWGSGTSGQLGTGETLADLKEPALVSSLLSKVVVQIGAGERYSVALTDEGKVYVWGQNTSSVFGLIGEEKNDVIYPEPMILPSLKDSHVSSIFSGNWHMVACTSETDVDFTDKGVLKVINNIGNVRRRKN